MANDDNDALIEAQQAEIDALKVQLNHVRAELARVGPAFDAAVRLRDELVAGGQTQRTQRTEDLCQRVTSALLADGQKPSSAHKDRDWTTS